MHIEQFDFNLPHELIAQYPLPQRSASKLLCLDRASTKIQHKNFCDFPHLLQPNDLLIFNNTKVFKARLLGYKTTGGKAEILIERIIDDKHILAHVKTSKKNINTTTIVINEQFAFTIIARQDDLFILKLTYLTNNSEVLSILEIAQKYGHVPLPPYVTRQDNETDAERYQSIFAQKYGAVAAPTASLHFDDKIINAIKNKGIDLAFVTLHVGAGTFQPVKVDNILQHKMHAEYMEIDKETCNKINQTKAKNGRVIAIGTTCVRCLETAMQKQSNNTDLVTTIDKTFQISPFFGDTDIFIFPGYKFQCVDALITNFHLPKSTLLMLVSAFAGHTNIMRAYNEAIEHKYRFFSYGDAMFLS